MTSRELLEKALVREEARGRDKNEDEQGKRTAILKARAIRHYLLIAAELS